MDNSNGNGYIRLNGNKGIWVLESVIELLHACGIKIKLDMDMEKNTNFIKPGDFSLTEDSHRLHGNDLQNHGEERR